MTDGRPERGDWLGRIRGFWDSQENLRFLSVGAYNALFGFLAFSLLQYWLRGRLHYLIVLLIAHALAVANAFVGHRYVTFRIRGHLLLDYLRFDLSYLGLLLFGMIAMPLLVEVGGLHPIASNALILGITTVASFQLHKRLSFRRKPPEGGSGANLPLTSAWQDSGEPRSDPQDEGPSPPPSGGR